jgi:hypothetical protein
MVPTTNWAYDCRGWVGAQALRVVEVPAALALPQEGFGHIFDDLNLTSKHEDWLLMKGSCPSAISIKEGERNGCVSFRETGLLRDLIRVDPRGILKDGHIVKCGVSGHL